MSKKIYRVVYMSISTLPSGIWIYRKRVPADMVEAFKRYTGKKTDTFKRSLGTRDKNEAKALAVTIDNEYQALLRKLKSQGHILPHDMKRVHVLLRLYGIVPKRSTELDEELIENLLVKASEELALTQAKVRVAQDVDELVTPKYWGLRHQKQVPLGNYLRNLQNIMRVLNICQRMFNDPSFDASKELDGSLLNLQKSRLGIDLTNDYTQSAIASPLPKMTSKTPSDIASLPTPRFTEALETWKQQSKPSNSSYTEFQYAVRLFTELHGDLPVGQITDRHVIAFREALRITPARLSSKYKDVSYAKVLEMTQKGEFQGAKVRSDSSLRKMIGGLRTILQVMLHDGYIDKNPASKKAPKNTDDGKSRPPYSFPELKKLFTSEMYQSDFWHSPVQDKPSRFWSPLIALYTGCRAGEIAQLHVTDIISMKKD